MITGSSTGNPVGIGERAKSIAVLHVPPTPEERAEELLIEIDHGKTTGCLFIAKGDFTSKVSAAIRAAETEATQRERAKWTKLILDETEDETLNEKGDRLMALAVIARKES